jgi:N-acetylglucosamine kinase-like BadF-type ATPase
MEGSKGYVLGIDAGQTSTKGGLADLAGSRAVYTQRGGVDHFEQRGAVQQNERVVEEVVRELCRLASVERDRIAAVAVGWTAVRPHSTEIAAVERILSGFLPASRCQVLPDYVTSLAGASAGADGIVVVAGGGSIAYGVTPNGRDAVVGGMGYLLGDEGSAYDIARRAVAAATRSSDGRDRRTALERVVREAFVLDDVRDITRLVYAHDFSRATLASLAPAVAAAAAGGDIVARDIMTYAGQELGRSAVAVARTLEMDAPFVYAAGGVFGAGELVLEPFRRTVQDALVGATVSPAAYPPVVGALLLARRNTNEWDDSAWLAAVAARFP